MKNRLLGREIKANFVLKYVNSTAFHERNLRRTLFSAQGEPQMPSFKLRSSKPIWVACVIAIFFLLFITLIAASGILHYQESSAWVEQTREGVNTLENIPEDLKKVRSRHPGIHPHQEQVLFTGL